MIVVAVWNRNQTSEIFILLYLATFYTMCSYIITLFLFGLILLDFQNNYTIWIPAPFLWLLTTLYIKGFLSLSVSQGVLVASGQSFGLFLYQMTLAPTVESAKRREITS